MFVRPTNPISHRLARLAFLAACVAALTVASAGPLHRFIGLDIEWAITIFRYGFYAAVAAVALGLATIVPTRPGDRRRGFVAAFLAVVIGLAGAWMPVTWFLWSQQLPALNDISTDVASPPAMVALLQLRRGASNPAAYPGAPAAVLQRAAYADIVPVVLPVAPAEAFKRVDRVVTAMGWDVVARAPADGRIEAVARTPVMGCRGDIVIRIRGNEDESRVDMRSSSRYGSHDIGSNASRIRAYLDNVEESIDTALEREERRKPTAPKKGPVPKGKQQQAQTPGQAPKR